MRALTATFCYLSVLLLLVAEAAAVTPQLDAADRVAVYYLGTSDSNTPAKDVRDRSLVRQLRRLILHSDGVWQPRPTPASTGDFQITFYKDGKVIYSVGIGENFFVRGEVGIPGRTCYIKNIQSEDAKAIRRIAFKVWFGANAPES